MPTAKNVYDDQDYLGDGVYAKWDGYGVELRANDHLNPTDTIYLEWEVLQALKRFYKRMTGKEL